MGLGCVSVGWSGLSLGGKYSLDTHHSVLTVKAGIPARTRTSISSDTRAAILTLRVAYRCKRIQSASCPMKIFPEVLYFMVKHSHQKETD